MAPGEVLSSGMRDTTGKSRFMRQFGRLKLVVYRSVKRQEHEESISQTERIGSSSRAVAKPLDCFVHEIRTS